MNRWQAEFAYHKFHRSKFLLRSIGQGLLDEQENVHAEHEEHNNYLIYLNEKWIIVLRLSR